jgi:hypothetical protein
MNAEQFKKLQEKIDAIAEDRVDEKIKTDPRDIKAYDRIPPEIMQQVRDNQEKRSRSGRLPEIPDNIRKILDKKFLKMHVPWKLGEDAVADADQIEAAIQQIIDMVSEADIDEDAKDNTMRSLEQAISDLYDV